MLNAETGLSNKYLELLQELSAGLALQTQRAEDFHSIPAYLAGVMQLAGVSLAIVKTVADGAMVLLSASSGGTITEQELLDIHQQTRALSSQDGPKLRTTFELPAPAEAGLPQSALRGLVFTHSIDDKHRMLLIIRHADAHLEPLTTQFLQLAARQLGKSLETQVIWASGPDALGQPFDHLTDREWMVLGGLNSDAGEKQLADQLGLSPHTLHSHIKSIYRKMGVQGRLPLLRRVEAALRDYRLKTGLKSRFAEIFQASATLAVG